MGASAEVFAAFSPKHKCHVALCCGPCLTRGLALLNAGLYLTDLTYTADALKDQPALCTLKVMDVAALRVNGIIDSRLRCSLR